ncbi:MAG: YdjY domain-containing protein, partial [Gemmataceae bacterium]
MRLATVGFFLVLGTSALADDAKPGITIDAEKKTVIVAAKVAPRKLEHLQEVYPIELIAGWAHPKGKKAHETVITIEAKPSDVHAALEKVGLKPGKPAKGENTVAEGPEIIVSIEVPAGDGPAKKLTLDKVLLDPKTKK